MTPQAAPPPQPKLADRRLMVSSKAVLLGAMLALVALDYRRSPGDESTFVAVAGLLVLALGVTLILWLGPMPKSLLIRALPIAVFLGTGIASGLLQGQSLYATLAMGVPLGIFIVTMLAVASFAQDPAELTGLLTMIIGFALASGLWKIGFGFVYYGLTLADVRYQILSGATPLLFAYGVAAVLLRHRRLALPAMVLALAAVALSVTRSYLLVFLVSTLVAPLALPPQSLPRSMARIGIGLLGVMVAITLIGLAEPQIIARWGMRLNAGHRLGFDLTWATRLAEVDYMLTRLQTDPAKLIYGFGIAAETRFSGAQAILIRAALGDGGLHYSSHGYGHNLYVGILYLGGLFTGAALIVTLLGSTVGAVLRSRRSDHDQTHPEARFALIWGIAACAGYAAFGLLGGTFGDRSISFYYAVAFGLMIGGPGNLRPPPVRPDTSSDCTARQKA